MNSALYDAATIILPMIFAIVFHEVAHGLMARRLGDPTASVMGRLSLNPLRHVDLFGTIILPGALHLAGLPVFGWAKPVPVDYNRLRNPKRDMAFVGAAGPATNFILATVSAIAIGLIARGLSGQSHIAPALAFVLDNLQNFILINVFLGVFNLLPLPPFDGSRILRGILPWPLARWLDRIEPYGILVFLTLFVILPQVVPSLHVVDNLIGPPSSWMLAHLGRLAAAVAGAPMTAANGG
ncbi:peptidase M50 [Novosphingobium nitrogenifigens DSM 19370]|uniref:Peptidase M50 n=1 Tax=Novosphingobium nitrogenifigens DSM 19370 TaxID=983920 RepID=F1ZAL1_9SPHN|nr:site-2 protease family protein [Novosphingobium nitrogenifigens]EGD58352.1 peptidase M50 [Novosphingobium nitrogenifigens DSM 19370]